MTKSKLRTFYELFLHLIYKKVNVIVKNLLIFIVLTAKVIIISGYALTIGNSIEWTNIPKISF